MTYGVEAIVKCSHLSLAFYVSVYLPLYLCLSLFLHLYLYLSPHF